MVPLGDLYLLQHQCEADLPYGQDRSELVGQVFGNLGPLCWLHRCVSSSSFEKFVVCLVFPKLVILILSFHWNTKSNLEHISPYYPNIYISVNMERLLGRIPTIIAFIAISRSLGISRKGWIQQIAAQIMFMLQPTLSSMSLPFHLSHIVVQHFGGMHFLNGAYARKLKWEAKIKSA